MQDRYGNERSTSSSAALEHYSRGVDLALAGQPGAVQAFQQATTLDPQFAVAYADLARTLQTTAKVTAARAAMDQARELEAGLGDAERRHVKIVGHLLAGEAPAAMAAIQEQMRTNPRDVMTLQPACGVFGLIGFSGRSGREAENLAFMESVASHYVDDWWFDSQMAFALCEVGQLAKANQRIDSAIARNPDNANAAHHLAHIHYEAGEHGVGRQTLAAFRAGYPREGVLDCHLAWHQALWALDAGDEAEVWAILERDVGVQRASIPPINLVTDLVALLLRAELHGLTRRPELWRVAADCAQQYFAAPGVSFADYHCAIAYALDGREAPLATLQHPQRGVAADLVGVVARAFAAFAKDDWPAMIQGLTPIMSSHERLGGSRAQRDLLELSYAFALTQAGNAAEAERFLAQRRPVCQLDSGPIGSVGSTAQLA